MSRSSPRALLGLADRLLVASSRSARPEDHQRHDDENDDQQDLPCARALAHLAEFAPLLRILGSYPSCRPAAADEAAVGAESDGLGTAGDVGDDAAAWWPPAAAAAATAVAAVRNGVVPVSSW